MYGSLIHYAKPINGYYKSFLFLSLLVYLNIALYMHFLCKTVKTGRQIYFYTYCFVSLIWTTLILFAEVTFSDNLDIFIDVYPQFSHFPKNYTSLRVSLFLFNFVFVVDGV